jgi:hypothetical protein
VRSKTDKLTAHLQAWPGWGHAQQVLCKMVDGYGMHLDVRRQLARDVHGDGDGRITPMWTDLTMWAVLAGQHELAIELWSKAESPLRAALMASQLCQRLAKEPLLRADSKELGVSFIRRDILYTTTYFILRHTLYMA